VAKCGVSALVKEAMALRDDGNQVDVHLDRDFKVLSAPADHEGSRRPGRAKRRWMMITGVDPEPLKMAKGLG
jgi:hypothetical protein